jgi:hypothetical protein
MSLVDHDDSNIEDTGATNYDGQRCTLNYPTKLLSLENNIVLQCTDCLFTKSSKKASRERMFKWMNNLVSK